MARYQVTGSQPVVIDGQTHQPGATVETEADVTFLLAIGALAPAQAAPADEAEEGEAD
jgi:hypothetical protein